MPMNRLLAETGTAPEQVARLNVAYERALSDLGLVDRNDPLTEMVPKRVIEIGRTTTDPAEISQPSAP